MTKGYEGLRPALTFQDIERMRPNWKEEILLIIKSPDVLGGFGYKISKNELKLELEEKFHFGVIDENAMDQILDYFMTQGILEYDNGYYLTKKGQKH